MYAMMSIIKLCLVISSEHLMCSLVGGKCESTQFLKNKLWSQLLCIMSSISIVSHDAVIGWDIQFGFNSSESI